MSNKETITIKDIVGSLGKEKYLFIQDVENSIKDYISSQSVGKCLTFVEINPDGTINRTWEPSASLDYANCLKAFCTGKRFHGKELDSSLTNPVVKVVTGKFEKLYSKNEELISKALLDTIMRDKVMVESLTNTMIDCSATKIVTLSAKRKAVELLILEFNKLLSTNFGQSVSSFVTHTVTVCVSLPIAKATAMLIMKFIAVHLKVIIAKVLSSAAIKGIITIAIKKFVVAAIAASIFKLIGAKLGVSAGAAFAVILIPIIVGYITYLL